MDCRCIEMMLSTPFHNANCDNKQVIGTTSGLDRSIIMHQSVLWRKLVDTMLHTLFQQRIVCIYMGRSPMDPTQSNMPRIA